MTLETLDMFAGYPNGPGWKRAGTSRDAAEAMKVRAPTLRDRVFALLKEKELTADECAEALGKSVLSIRPRLSELVALRMIFDTGRTRLNASGVKAAVWRAK